MPHGKPPLTVLLWRITQHSSVATLIDCRHSAALSKALQRSDFETLCGARMVTMREVGCHGLLRQAAPVRSSILADIRCSRRAACQRPLLYLHQDFSVSRKCCLLRLIDGTVRSMSRPSWPGRTAFHPSTARTAVNVCRGRCRLVGHALHCPHNTPQISCIQSTCTGQ